MNPLSLLFFGSFQSYSVQVLDILRRHFRVTGVVTTPPAPSGRHMELTPTAVELYSRKNKIPISTPANLYETPQRVTRRKGPVDPQPSAASNDDMEKRGGMRGSTGGRGGAGPAGTRPDFLVVAGYGKLIPASWLTYPKIMAVNMHPSLLPRYRGAMPAEWAILRQEKETGVTLVKMTEEFDKGDILAQQSIPIKDSDTRESLYKKLYDLGGKLLVDTLPKIVQGTLVPRKQPPGEYFYARRLTREDGFVPWAEFFSAVSKHPEALETKFRGLFGWPGVWSTTPGGKRVKLVALFPKPLLQLDGKNPAPLEQLRKNLG